MDCCTTCAEKAENSHGIIPEIDTGCLCFALLSLFGIDVLGEMFLKGIIVI
jgi:hypothetical protein